MRANQTSGSCLLYTSLGSDDVKKIVEMTHDIIRNYTKSKGIAIDFTMGNGYDTLFLAQQDFAKVIAFDIQEESLMRTKDVYKRQVWI